MTGVTMISAVVAVVLVVRVVVKGVVVVVEAVPTVAVKYPVWAGAVIDTLVEMLDIGVRADVLVVDAVAITLGVSVSVSKKGVDMLSDVVNDLLMDAFAGVRATIIFGIVSAIDVFVLVDVNINEFVVVITVEFVMPAPSEGFSCGAAIDCRPMAALDCARALQARMPSYQV